MERRVSSRTSAQRDDSGATLIEVLVASVIMGSAAIVLVMGMGALFTSATHNRQATTASVVARDYAEALELSVAQTGAWCHATYPVDFSPPTAYSVSASYGACPPASATTAQYQTVVITVTMPGGSTELLRMVVRAP